MGTDNIALMAHLMRRAGFGAARAEIEAYAANGYDATVEALINPSDPQWMGDYMIRRFHHEQSGMMGPRANGENWLYRMITTSAPLLEKMCLFWHSIFATGYPKVIHGKVLWDQITMLRRHGMGNVKTLLLELSKDPAMIIWLDNQDNHKGAINENYGRELLELFSLGVGNYSEDDIKECARAFTGWTIGNTEYMVLRSERDSDWPYGRIAWHFEYRSDDHDEGEKVFLGQTGQLNGDDIIDRICQQESTARFIARHMYHFFVADEPPVPSWPYTPPRHPEAIETLVQAYFDSDYDIRSMLRALFHADFFKAADIRYEKVKSPAEFVAGVLRLTGEFDRPRREILDRALQMTWMGQQLNNPPSVEGWHQGTAWIDTGTLVERINFASEQFGDVNKPGVKAMIDQVLAGNGEAGSGAHRVAASLDQMGVIAVSDQTRDILMQLASQGDDMSKEEQARENVANLFRLIAASHEFQRA
jgi:uncharacterized protein (DUF1800 family)